MAAQVIFGDHARRLLVALTMLALTTRTSSIKVADRTLASFIWGDTTWPRHWRGKLLATLRGLTYLHVRSPDENGPWGDGTALINHVGDLASFADLDACDLLCQYRCGRRHHHLLIDIGPALLGSLEQLGKPDREGIRRYQFGWESRQRKEPSLRTLGRQGLLVQRYLPAVLGSPANCSLFTRGQHRIIQTLVRETSRTRPSKKESAKPEIVLNGMVPAFNGRGVVQCPYLARDNRHIAFNGNKKLKGRGYLLTSPGGWMAKCGYDTASVAVFLDDLKHISELLGLTVTAIGRSGWADLNMMREMAASDPKGLAAMHMRVYTEEGHIERWNRLFGWQDDEMHKTTESRSRAARLSVLLRDEGIRQADVARHLGVTVSYLNQLLHGKRPMQEERANQIAECVRRLAGARTSRPSRNLSMLERAMEYRRILGWGVIPQIPREKRPAIKWKQFQHALPCEDDVRLWWSDRPDCGIALIAGPVSGVLVIDVDGVEAEQELLKRLGAEPNAPKVLSGSGEPSRYHLFFRHPPISTKAKATPWHPKLEFRGARGLVVLPPSVHKSGSRYTWAPGRSIWEMVPPDLPSEVLEALKAAPSRPDGTVECSDGPLACSGETQRFLNGEFSEGPNWNQRLFHAACDLNGRGVPHNTAEVLLLNGAKPWDDHEKENATRTITSAYSKERRPASR